MPTDFAGSEPVQSVYLESHPISAAPSHYQSTTEQPLWYGSAWGVVNDLRWSSGLAQAHAGMLDLGCAHSAELRNVAAHQLVWRIEAAQLSSHWLTATVRGALPLVTEDVETDEDIPDNYNLASFHVSVPRRSMGKWKAKVNVTGRHEPRMVLSEEQLRALAELADADEQ